MLARMSGVWYFATIWRQFLRGPVASRVVEFGVKVQLLYGDLWQDSMLRRMRLATGWIRLMS
jgi:hypothetical protein